MESIGKDVTITLGGKVRELRYDFGQIKRLKREWQFKTYEELCKLDVEEYLPAMLLEGATDKSGLTLEVIEAELTGPDTDVAFTQFCTAFFPPRVAQMLSVIERNKDRLLESMDVAAKTKEPEKTAEPEPKSLLQ